MTERHDIVIPLGVKSYENENFEIKVAIVVTNQTLKFAEKLQTTSCFNFEQSYLTYLCLSFLFCNCDKKVVWHMMNSQ